ncbi:transcription factor TGA3-like [Amaranthus tricolor]|uniref:transcription factor TGA3-like n=1 Tax=Amaranthus tricolor TaxID=29722 RepID=UPI002583F992|nr:transcription factor TGA3-like [Amaranthus tricolor]
MSSTTIQVTNSVTMGMYEPPKAMSRWRDTSKAIVTSNAGASSSIQAESGHENKFNYEYASPEMTEPSLNSEDIARLSEKVQRRLAQNREAARKSRLRKKAYVQQLESSRLKLAQLELQIQQTKQIASHMGTTLHANLGFTGHNNAGLAAFEMQYGHWVEEQNRQNCELRTALEANVSDVDLIMLVDVGLNHYSHLFRIKAEAAKTDVFYLMSGMWRTSVEQFFIWIGGFRPSELLNILMPQLESLTSLQMDEIGRLRYASRQAEDALSRGVDKLQQTLTQIMFAEAVGVEMYGIQMTSALEKLGAIEGFVNQADHLREQALRQMSRILTPRQAARGMVALGEYFHRMRTLSTLWSARPRDTG